MTSERDFDRLARAWLELGPNEAPDRVVAAVLQAAEATPQVRRPIRWPSWRFSHMTRLPIAAGAAAVLVVLISGAVLFIQRDRPAASGPGPSMSAAPSPSPAVSPSASAVSSSSPVVSPSAPAAPAKAIVLQRAPANVGCDSIGIDYDMATIRIDPAADIAVWAETRTGQRLATFWSAGFTATDGDPPVIRDPDGKVMAANGSGIDIRHWQSYEPWNRFFLCPGPASLYILEQAPR